MAWALVKPWNNRIVKSARHKYNLLRFDFETKDVISKRTIKNYKDGDPITVIYRKRYEKWFINSVTGHTYKDYFTETNEVTYILKEIKVGFVH
ncbi:hypothetical protein MZM54_00370 [[Brevibacterium] frigoritolerans]|nr:hypothetical protein [Peribacillus frigoritolerans]